MTVVHNILKDVVKGSDESKVIELNPVEEDELLAA